MREDVILASVRYNEETSASAGVTVRKRLSFLRMSEMRPGVQESLYAIKLQNWFKSIPIFLSRTHVILLSLHRHYYNIRRRYLAS